MVFWYNNMKYSNLVSVILFIERARQWIFISETLGTISSFGTSEFSSKYSFLWLFTLMLFLFSTTQGNWLH